MLHLATDVSYEHPVVSCGYVLTKATGGSERLVEMGSRVFNTEHDDRDIEWGSARGEYRALITGVRAALDYDESAILCHVDHESLVTAVRHVCRDDYEPYFRHALMSFLGRFDEWRISAVSRERNEAAHTQARAGLKASQEYLDTDVMEAP
jgi:hypothetical protein